MQGIAMRVMAEPGKYSLQQLQQAVQSGSLPAYIGIPLIQEKIKQQKQMQGAEQAQAPQGPSIAEQVMQEARGVQALPTNLPEQYAGGGIVAFADGGNVDSYSGARARVQAAQQKLYTYGLNQRQRDPAGFQAAQSELAAAQTAMNALERQISGGPVGLMGQAIPVAPPTPAPAPVPAPAPAAAAPALTPASAPAPAPARAPAPAPAAGIAGLAPGAKPTFAAPAGDTYRKMAEDFFSDYGTQARNMDVQADAAKAAARSKVTGQAFEEYRKSLEDEAKEAGADKEQAKYMSIFKAGLAMMAGTSQHALENIGRGAMVGTEDYQAAVKDLKKAERERRKEFAHIEQARRAEAIGDRDTAISEIDKARDRSDARVRYTGEGIYKATGLDKERAYDLAKTQFNADTEIFKTNLAGQYTLAAAKERARDTGTRGAFTQAQLARLRMDAAKQVDENAIRAQVAKRLGLSRTPPPGADAQFDSQTRIAFDSAVNDIIDRALGASGGGGAGNSYQGYRLVPD
jgi:hypothetical protein